MIAGMTQTSAIVTTSIDFSGKNIALDIYHGGYHAEDLANLYANLSIDNTVVYINETWELADDVDALFLTQADAGLDWTPAQVADIAAWYALGEKLLWVSGDSDYGGYFNESAINNVLEAIDCNLRLDGTSISDPIYSDGSSYRACAPYFGIGDPLVDTSDILTATMKDCTAGCVYHGPCSVLGWNGTGLVDIRLNVDDSAPDVVTLMRFSATAVSDDSDASFGTEDLYANSAISGYYPALVYEAVETGHVIASGETIYSDYKYMYDQKTENGVYNDGVQFGQVIVNNLLNFLLGEPQSTSAFVVLPVVAIGVIYALIRRK